MPSDKTGIKTMAIRLEPELHAQLAIIAQLEDTSIAEEIRMAIEGHVAAKRSAPELAAKADAVLAEIEREMSTRRDALSSLFGEEASTEPTRPRPHGRGGKEGAPSE